MDTQVLDRPRVTVETPVPLAPTKLWVDDRKDPSNTAVLYGLEPDGWEWVTSADQAIEAIRATEYSVIALDHDLGPDGNGEDVLRAMVPLYATGTEIDRVLPEMYFISAWHDHNRNMEALWAYVVSGR